MQAWVAVRPEKITLRASHRILQYNWLKGTVRDIAYLGSHSIYHVQLSNGRVVIANVSNQQRNCDDCPTWDDEVCLSWDANSGVVLTQ